MSYFPFFEDIEGRHCLIVGGGRVAARKAEKLRPFRPCLSVCAPGICDEIRNMDGVELIEREFAEEMLAGADMVIAATDNSKLNHKISALCKEKKIPVNVVDDKDYCSFIFPALINRGSMTIGITTGGASPLAARKTREIIEQALPENIEEALEMLESIRGDIKRRYESEKERMEALEEEWEKITGKSI